MDRFDPSRPDFEPYGLTCVAWKPEAMRRPDHHNEIELNLLLKGWITYLFAGRKVRIGAGQLAAFWASIPHQIIAHGEATEYLVVTIPFASFLQFKLPPQFRHALLHGAVMREDLAEPAQLETERFRESELDLRTNSEEHKAIVLLELEARLRRMALRVADDRSPVAQGGCLQDGSLNKVEQMACLIAQRYLEPLTAETIAQVVGVHRNYAMNLFKKAFGATLVSYLTYHRVSHAQRLLATTDMKILDVAMASGFQTLSRFNEAFRRTCGCSPRQYRAKHSV